MKKWSKGVRPIAVAAGGVVAITLATLTLRKVLRLDCQIIDKEPLEPLAPMQPAWRCDPTPKPGVEAFRDFVLEHYGGGDVGITRACGPTIKSEHNEGRAWDWLIIPGWTAVARYEPPKLDELLSWLLAPDCHGRGSAAMARRAGLMYILWSDKGWRSQSTPLAPAATIYTIPASQPPHLDHVHFSFDLAGAAGKTSLYRYI